MRKRGMMTDALDEIDASSAFVNVQRSRLACSHLQGFRRCKQTFYFFMSSTLAILLITQDLTYALWSAVKATFAAAGNSVEFERTSSTAAMPPALISVFISDTNRTYSRTTRLIRYLTLPT